MVNVMIVDDSDSIRLILKDILLIGKHNLVSELSSGINVLEEYTKTNPDVVLLDMAMPKKDGISALREILDTNPDAKIIMITASDNINTMKECISVGAIAYLLKPFNFEDVLKTITDILDRT